MHGSVAIALLVLSVSAVPLRDAPRVPKRLMSLSSALQKGDADVGEWEHRRPRRCEGEIPLAACKLIKYSWANLLDVQHGGDSYSVELWAIPQSSVTSAKRLLRLLKDGDEFGGTFGKAPEAHYRCQNTVLATVGTYRAPRPHDKVDGMVKRWVAAHCGSKQK